MSYQCSSGLASSNTNNNNFLSNSLENENFQEDGGIKDPKPLEYLFEKELINNQNRYIRLVDDFVPSRKTHHLTAKFYARHEQKEPEKQFVYRSFVQKPDPIRHCTENNVYGWMPQSLKGHSTAAMLSQLNFINAPKQRCFITVIGEELQSDRITERPSFNGLRFHLH